MPMEREPRTQSGVEPGTADLPVSAFAESSGAVTDKRAVRKYEGGRWLDLDDEVAVEFPLTLRVNGEEFATLVCTPNDLEHLAIGFLASEGVIRAASEISSIAVNADSGFAYVELKNVSVPGREFYAKRMIGSCCGKSRQFYFVNDARTARTVPVRHSATPEQCFAWMSELERLSGPFQRTGGVHNAALFDAAGGCLAAAADIGRHNALDKLFGFTLRHRMPTADKTIAFSGRLSSEVVLKAAKIGAGLLLSKSAPTDLALRLADDLGITAVGFIRGGRMNVYTHPERISEHEE